ncbi:nucleotidyltransferase domain-containing protein [Crocosphaera sp. XPORK-15E]|uniref:nucleotidyltransferase domain-containing protein n=1 Tax=Crocosphaera sp. XPORK-15E TaxID=3110247 RepID=UPI002B1ED2F0|nr:nucleotidyltransferase domain-containing protein [Crocosphaera sp. XPORK-15E]MEA5533751.1 nucleotidyltransferase domain-containing protein [Crocosphaera sp. XPORK-15E]
MQITNAPNQIKIYQRLQVNSEELKRFCENNLIAELAVFGSILRDDFSSSSDVDLLISYLPSAPRGLLEKIQLKEKLESLFNRPVDLISKTSIQKSSNWIKRQEILNSAEVIYRA